MTYSSHNLLPALHVYCKLPVLRPQPKGSGVAQRKRKEQQPEEPYDDSTNDATNACCLRQKSTCFLKEEASWTTAAAAQQFVSLHFNVSGQDAASVPSHGDGSISGSTGCQSTNGSCRSSFTVSFEQLFTSLFTVCWTRIQGWRSGCRNLLHQLEVFCVGYQCSL